jgi:hypothetical protein
VEESRPGVLVNRRGLCRDRLAKKLRRLRGHCNDEGHGAFLVEKSDFEKRVDLGGSGQASWRIVSVEVSRPDAEEDLGRRCPTEAHMWSEISVINEYEPESAFEIFDREWREPPELQDFLKRPDGAFDDGDGSTMVDFGGSTAATATSSSLKTDKCMTRDISAFRQLHCPGVLKASVVSERPREVEAKQIAF